MTLTIASTCTVTCTNTTAYSVGLDQGTWGTAVTARKMKSPTTAATVNYSLFSDSGYTTNWGNSTGVRVSGTGNAQTLTVYGQIPAQTTPAAASDYADSVTITVTY